MVASAVGGINEVVLSGETGLLVPLGDLHGRYFLNFTAVDEPNVLAHIAGALGEHGISTMLCTPTATPPRWLFDVPSTTPLSRRHRI